MKSIVLEISDQVNCRLVGLDPAIKRVIREKNSYFQQWARHTQIYKAGYWNGKEYLVDMGGRTFINQLSNILPDLIDAGYQVDIKDERPSFSHTFPDVNKDMFSHINWPAKHKFSGQPIELMDHQVEALRNFFLNPQGVQILPTSAGKTLITAAMAYHCEPIGRTVVVVPNKSLVTQTEEDFLNIGLDVGVYFGDRKEFDKTHTICTWQSLSILSKKGKTDQKVKDKLLKLLNNVNVVIVDETHSAKAKELKNLLSGPLSTCPIRWGLSGTMPKDEFDANVIVNVIGPVISEIMPKELQDKGVLSHCDIHIKQLLDAYDFNDYHKEHEYLCGDIDRLKWIAKFVVDISKTGNTLVLVGRRKSGINMVEMVEELGYDSVFVSGTMKVKDRKAHYDEVHDSNSKIIFATYGVAAVGINVPRIFNLVLLEPGKSFVRVIQSIGRGLRTAKDKDTVDIYDITSSCKFSKRHLAARKKFYKEKEYPYKIEKIDWRNE